MANRDEQAAQQAVMEDIGREWNAARVIIAGFLAELRPDQPVQVHLHNASAIIARLAHHEPPILLEMQRE